MHRPCQEGYVQLIRSTEAAYGGVSPEQDLADFAVGQKCAHGVGQRLRDVRLARAEHGGLLLEDLGDDRVSACRVEADALRARDVEGVPRPAVHPTSTSAVSRCLVSRFVVTT